MTKQLADLKQWFLNYSSSFIHSHPQLKEPLQLKQDHSLRVAQIAKSLALELSFSEENVLLSTAAGLIHDSGRFQQYCTYGTFMDKRSVNHAKLGVEILKNSQALLSFPSDAQEKLLKAVTYHNRATLPQNDNELCLPKILRDADKIDIWKIVIDYFHNPSEKQKKAIELDLSSEDTYSTDIAQAIMDQTVSRVKSLRFVNDFKLLTVGWVYDINFSCSFRTIKEKQYIEKLQNLLPKDKTIESVFRGAIDHVQKMS